MVTVEQLLQKRNISYREQGQDFLVKCLNPKHEDSNPSMRINKYSGVYHCFSCGYKGSLYRDENIEVSMVASKAIELRERLHSLYKANIEIPANAIPVDFDFRGISKNTLQEFEAFTCVTHPVFDGRIVFPIRNILGKIVCFQARNINSKTHPKYIFEPKSVSVPIFPSSPDLRAGELILVEGLFDMLNLWDKGIKNVVCTFGANLGTSNKVKTNKKDLEKLMPYKIMGVNKLKIFYDNDTAGMRAAELLESNRVLNKEFLIEIVDFQMGDKKDPGSLSYEDIFKLKKELGYA